jgi:MFS family permease
VKSPFRTSEATGTPLGREFGLLWTGQTVSSVGDRITIFVVPTLMIFALDASAFEVGVVAMAQYLGIPFIGPIAGVLVDRWDKRRTMIMCDLVRVVAVTVIPVAYWMDMLSMPLLFTCVAVISGATIFFNIGQLVVVPATVRPDQLVRGYSRLEASRTVAEVGGPSIAGALYHVGGAVALVIDAVTYLFSAACFKAMKPCGEKTIRDGSWWSRLTLGIRLNWADPVLRRCLFGTFIMNSGGPIFVTVLPVLAYRGLGMSAAVYGAVMSAAAVGAVIGAMVAPRLSGRLGTGRLMAWAVLGHCVAGLGILAAPAVPAAIVIGVTIGFYGFFMACANVCSAPTRQVRMSEKDQGVMHAAYRSVTWGIIPFAALAGGTAVELLVGYVDVLAAAKITMVAGTLLAAIAFVPLVGIQPMLDRAARDKAARENGAPAEAGRGTGDATETGQGPGEAEAERGPGEAEADSTEPAATGTSPT